MSFLKLCRTLLPALLFTVMQVRAQSEADQKKKAALEQFRSLIESKKYYFQANSATSMKGRTIQLTGGYFLRFRGAGGCQIRDNSLRWPPEYRTTLEKQPLSRRMSTR